jgi:hypothetical protein
MKVATDGPKVSHFAAAGFPQNCFLPSCRASFERSCFRTADNRYYCSKTCAEIGDQLDMSHVEELRPKLPSHLPTLKQKQFGAE